MLNAAKANLKLRMMAGFNGFTSVEIKEIPKQWESFQGTKDEWCGIEMPSSENSSACLYKGKAKSVFDPHEHTGIKEHMTVMNEGGKIRVTIEDLGVFDVEYPNSIVVPIGKVHAAEFITDSVIMCVWHPQFKKGWDAIFKEEVKE